MAGQDLFTIVHCRNEVLRMGRAENQRGSDSDQQSPRCETELKTSTSDFRFLWAKLCFGSSFSEDSRLFSERIRRGLRPTLIVFYFEVRRRRRTRIAICLTR